jgi:hypothetical protein
MDVPTRQSYVAALVNPDERVYASGLMNITRTGAWRQHLRCLDL